MNMFKPTKATTVAEYLAAVPEERKKAIQFLHEFIQKAAPKFEPHFAYNMLGYGSFPYLNYKKEIIQWPIIAMASQKDYMSIYVCALEAGKYIAEKYQSELGKVSVGKSCIRFRKFEDLNLVGLKKVLLIAAKSPGLVDPNAERVSSGKSGAKSSSKKSAKSAAKKTVKKTATKSVKKSVKKSAKKTAAKPAKKR